MKKKVIFKVFSKEIDDALAKRYPKANEYDFARKCAIDLSYGVSPTDAYIKHSSTLKPQRASEIFTMVMNLTKVLIKC